MQAATVLALAGLLLGYRDERDDQMPAIRETLTPFRQFTGSMALAKMGPFS